MSLCNGILKYRVVLLLKNIFLARYPEFFDCVAVCPDPSTEPMLSNSPASSPYQQLLFSLPCFVFFEYDKMVSM